MISLLSDDGEGHQVQDAAGPDGADHVVVDQEEVENVAVLPVHWEGRPDGENASELWSSNAMQKTEPLCNALSDDADQSCLVAQLVGDVEGVPGDPRDAGVE